MSAIRRIDGAGGKAYVPRARNSLMMSFCVVPWSCSGADSLRLGGDDIERQQPRRGGVDGHRRVHLVERDTFQQRLHVAAVGDRHADLSDLAARELVVGVVARLGRQVEGDR